MCVFQLAHLLLLLLLLRAIILRCDAASPARAAVAVLPVLAIV
jgi:hypothetical protein